MTPPNPNRHRHASFSSSSSTSSFSSTRHPAQPPHEDYADDGVDPDDRFEPPTAEQVAFERRRALTRILLLLLSLCFLAGIVAIILKSGVLASQFTPDDYNANIPVAPGNNSLVFYQAKVQALCALTEFKDACVGALSGGSNPRASDGPKALLLLSVGAASTDVARARSYAAGVDVQSLQSRTRLGFADCDELLDHAAGELQASAAGVAAVALDNLLLRTVAGVRDALSAAVAFEETCADGLAGSTEAAVAQLLAILTNATENTRNSLAMVSTLTTPLDGVYDLPAPPPVSPAPPPHAGRKVTAARRLFSAVGEVAPPDAVVAKDGSGHFTTISDALTVVNKTTTMRRDDGRFVIYVKEGVYDEIVRVTSAMPNLTLYGDGPDRTIVTGNRSYADGYSLYGSATFAVSGFGFVAKGITFRNTAGPEKGPATALRVGSDLAAIYDCHVEGHRNALHAHAHRQFYRECVVSGGADAISGDAAAVFQNCEVEVDAPAAAGGRPSSVAAQSRVDRHEPTGFVLQNCSITGAAGGAAQAVLGRPAKEHSRVVVVQSYLGKVVTAEGWGLGDGGGGDDSAEVAAETTVYFGEFGNRGPGATVGGRVRWEAVHLLADAAEVMRFTTEEFVQGVWWLNSTGVPFYTGVLKVS